jgi:hypothetical protein
MQLAWTAAQRAWQNREDYDDPGDEQRNAAERAEDAEEFGEKPDGDTGPDGGAQCPISHTAIVCRRRVHHSDDNACPERLLPINPLPVRFFRIRRSLGNGATKRPPNPSRKENSAA